MQNIASAAPQAAPALPEKPLWAADKGSTLRASLQKWADQARWTLVWDVPEGPNQQLNYPILAPLTFTGSVDQAVAAYGIVQLLVWALRHIPDQRPAGLIGPLLQRSAQRRAFVCGPKGLFRQGWRSLRRGGCDILHLARAVNHDQPCLRNGRNRQRQCNAKPEGKILNHFEHTSELNGERIFR